MASLTRAGYLDVDVEMLVERVNQIYRQRGGYVQLTLTGELVAPYPYFRFDGRVVKGPPISEARFRAIEEVPHRETVVSVDAAARILFDAGSFKIVSAKVAGGAWRGVERLRLMDTVKRIRVVESLDEAADWLAEIELEAVINLVKSYSGALVLLDRPLVFRGGSLSGKLFRRLVEKDWRVVGLPKSSSVRLSSGESALGYVSRLGGRIFRDMAWSYYPLIEDEKLGVGIGVVKLSPSGPAFRLDVTWEIALRVDFDYLAGMLAYLQDFSSPGYPLPLKIVHNLSRISDDELSLDRELLLEELGAGRASVASKLLEDSRGAEFKAKYLWGGVP
ncbi:MAG: DNA double-strand break repair nuclease NurA [Thermofilum sp.]|nr:DNA double-strand break repair nuclease NurA [Thermofilum sp.]